MENRKHIELFGKKIPVRTNGCSYNGNIPINYNPLRCNLFIQLETLCNADCPFCEYHSDKSAPFDIEKLAVIIKEIVSAADIGKLNFTGGEPTLNMSKFDETVCCISENINWNRRPEITLNTNGIRILEILKYEKLFDSIGLSRHHYDDQRNFRIFGTNTVADAAKIKEFQERVENKKLVQLRCNLITGEVDCYEEIVKYLEHAVKLGVSDCGFVTLMPLNDFCCTHQVDFPSLIKESDSLLEVAKWTRLDENDLTKELCQCSNYIYSTEDGRFCRFYRRHFCNSSLNAGQLVYDGEYLRFGFGGDIIF